MFVIYDIKTCILCGAEISFQTYTHTPKALIVRTRRTSNNLPGLALWPYRRSRRHVTSFIHSPSNRPQVKIYFALHQQQHPLTTTTTTII